MNLDTSGVLSLRRISRNRESKAILLKLVTMRDMRGMPGKRRRMWFLFCYVSLYEVWRVVRGARSVGWTCSAMCACGASGVVD
uniref:Uncharacterized protein n=1 Tax=Physcomitrium patens TaxID=3218 RepID=A0A2K1K5K9_PHYPA|nr:hypothetical protein PHYPA_010961 [Physcomitrium patens]